jgi:hypothetical protein
MPAARAERLIKMENQMRNQSEAPSLDAIKPSISREAVGAFQERPYLISEI